MKAKLTVHTVIQPNMFREGDKYYIIFEYGEKRHTINVGQKTYEQIERMLTEVILQKEEEEVKNSVSRETKTENDKKTLEEGTFEEIIEEARNNKKGK
nr:MAG: hypothetical protein [Microviridae sp.]